MTKITRAGIIKISFFILLVIACDFTAGKVLDYVYFHTTSGKYNKLNYVIRKSKEDILVFGNSHAECHYIPSIIKDSLHESCFNAGFRNQDILFTYAIHETILDRFSPKLIIFNIDKEMLYANKEAYENQKGKLSELLPFCNKEQGIRSVIEDRSIFEKFKLQSGIYPFNSSVVYLIKYLLSHSDNYKDGYYPIFGKLNPASETKKDLSGAKAVEHLNRELVGKMLEIFDHFHAHNTRIVAVISPTFRKYWLINDSVASIFSRQGIPLLNYSRDQRFHNNASYFSDDHHLNNEGAKLFSAIVAHDIKTILKK